MVALLTHVSSLHLDVMHCICRGGQRRNRGKGYLWPHSKLRVETNQEELMDIDVMHVDYSFCQQCLTVTIVETKAHFVQQQTHLVTSLPSYSNLSSSHPDFCFVVASSYFNWSHPSTDCCVLFIIYCYFQKQWQMAECFLTICNNVFVLGLVIWPWYNYLVG